ncbi:AraC family transcriptional regulator [Ancylobacter sp. Lp-2]|uniref:AraC family transcriptional regulator n=1 Tax=Ancylobacter sp. Lp-2 TaxID=2881339 RepID=UPI001E2CE561|nr:AraC family transcriptional regulator [Ancylobacter sp. Lp-2]
MQAPATRGIERIEARFRGNGYSPHRHDTYALGVTLSGVQTFRYRGETRFSLPGQIIVLHPDELHDGAAGTELGLRYRMLYLPPERVIEAAGGRRRLPFVPSPVLRDDELRRGLLEALGDLEGEPSDLAWDDLLARLADRLWLHADTEGAKGGFVAHGAVTRCREFLHDNSDRPVSSDELERISGLDRYALARHFRVMLGTSPHRYLVMRRLEKARALIGEGLSLSETASASGFADQSHFTRHFKSAFGMTPGRWLALTGTAGEGSARGQLRRGP